MRFVDNKSGRVSLVVSEHLPCTNVARVRFPHPVSYVDWVCWFSTLLREVFPRVLRFSPLIKNQHLIWFVNNDCKNNDLGNVDLISSTIVKRIWKLNCWICAIEINVIIIIIKNTWFLYYSFQLWVEIVSPLSKLCICGPILLKKKYEHWNQGGCCFLKCKILTHWRWCLSIRLLRMLF